MGRRVSRLSIPFGIGVVSSRPLREHRGNSLEIGEIMDEAQEFITIGEAVEAALNDWSQSEHSLADMEMLVDDFVQKALDDWKDTPEGELPVKVSGADAGLIAGAVLNAMADWHAGGTDFDEMASMAEDFALSAFENWKESRVRGHAA